MHGLVVRYVGVVIYRRRELVGVEGEIEAKRLAPYLEARYRLPALVETLCTPRDVGVYLLIRKERRLYLAVIVLLLVRALNYSGNERTVILHHVGEVYARRDVVRHILGHYLLVDGAFVDILDYLLHNVGRRCLVRGGIRLLVFVYEVADRDELFAVVFLLIFNFLFRRIGCGYSARRGDYRAANEHLLYLGDVPLHLVETGIPLLLCLGNGAVQPVEAFSALLLGGRNFALKLVEAFLIALYQVGRLRFCIRLGIFGHFVVIYVVLYVGNESLLELCNVALELVEARVVFALDFGGHAVRYARETLLVDYYVVVAVFLVFNQLFGNLCSYFRAVYHGCGGNYGYDASNHLVGYVHRVYFGQIVGEDGRRLVGKHVLVYVCAYRKLFGQLCRKFVDVYFPLVGCGYGRRKLFCDGRRYALVVELALYASCKRIAAVVVDVDFKFFGRDGAYLLGNAVCYLVGVYRPCKVLDNRCGDELVRKRDVELGGDVLGKRALVDCGGNRLLFGLLLALLLFPEFLHYRVCNSVLVDFALGRDCNLVGYLSGYGLDVHIRKYVAEVGLRNDDLFGNLACDVIGRYDLVHGARRSHLFGERVGVDIADGLDDGLSRRHDYERRNLSRKRVVVYRRDGRGLRLYGFRRLCGRYGNLKFFGNLLCQLVVVDILGKRLGNVYVLCHGKTYRVVIEIFCGDGQLCLIFGGLSLSALCHGGGSQVELFGKLVGERLIVDVLGDSLRNLDVLRDGDAYCIVVDGRGNLLAVRGSKRYAFALERLNLVAEPLHRACERIVYAFNLNGDIAELLSETAVFL